MDDADEEVGHPELLDRRGDAEATGLPSLLADDVDDVLAAMDLSDAELRRITEAARARVLAEHSSAARARELVALVRGNAVPCKFNLIPFNPFPNSGYERSTNENIRVFRDILQQAGFVVTVRKTRGDDIDAACGQLAGQVQDKTRRQQKWQQILVEQ